MATLYDGRRAEMARNLLRAYSDATNADIVGGLAWYPRAVAGVDAWAQAFELPRATVACVIAAISPQCNWTDNLRIALELLQDRLVGNGGGALNANIIKARRIHADRATDLANYFKSGPKVNAFARNLQGDGSAVTVDTHATQAALNDVTVTIGLTAARYAVFADAYRAAAMHAGLRPCDFQAVVWHIWKRKYPRGLKNKLRQQWHVVGEL